MATIQINHITFPRLSNAYHVAFFSNVKAGIDKYQAVNMGIPDEVFERFDGALDLEQDIVNRARASAFTKQLQEFDTKRDNYYRRVYYKLNITLQSQTYYLLLIYYHEKVGVFFIFFTINYKKRGKNSHILKVYCFW